MGRRLITIILAAGTLIACGDDDGATDAGRSDVDGAARPCTTNNDCLPGWSCAVGECACGATGAETCNMIDEDCDGLVDEGRGEVIGCGPMEACVEGACACAPENFCDGECIDTQEDRLNCGGCGMACAVTEACFAGACCEAERLPVDVLFVIDNSASMAEEQDSLTEQLPRMVRALTTGDVDGDGTQDFPAAADLHLGVVTTDMGTGNVMLPSCDEPMLGDDGVLRTQGDASNAACMATYPPFLTFDPDAGDIEAAAAAFACVAKAGVDGCNFEQQLEASLKALTPSTSGITFFGGTTGHGDTTNAGFLRPDSVLAVIVLTDEDDCSVSDAGLYDPTNPDYMEGPFNLRCTAYPDALYPVMRYVEGLRALRADQPERFVFAAIAGVPTDLVDQAYDTMLEDTRMQNVPSTEVVGDLVPSCDIAGRGKAYPPRRLVETARELDTTSITVVQSICQEDFGPAMGAVIEGIAIPLGSACLI